MNQQEVSSGPVEMVPAAALLRIGARGRGAEWSPHGLFAIVSAQAVSLHMGLTLLPVLRHTLPFSDAFSLMWSPTLQPQAHPAICNLCVFGHTAITVLPVTRDAGHHVGVDDSEAIVGTIAGLDLRGVREPPKRRKPRAEGHDDASYRLVGGGWMFSGGEWGVVVAVATTDISYGVVSWHIASKRMALKWQLADEAVKSCAVAAAVVSRSSTANSKVSSTLAVVATILGTVDVIDCTSWQRTRVIALSFVSSAVSVAFTADGAAEAVGAVQIACGGPLSVAIVHLRDQTSAPEVTRYAVPHVIVTRVRHLAEGQSIAVCGNGGCGIMTLHADGGVEPYAPLLRTQSKQPEISYVEAALVHVDDVDVDDSGRLLTALAFVAYQLFESALVLFDATQTATPIALRRFLTTRQQGLLTRQLTATAVDPTRLRATCPVSRAWTQGLADAVALYTNIKQGTPSLITTMTQYAKHPLVAHLRNILTLHDDPAARDASTEPSSRSDIIAELVLPRALYLIGTVYAGPADVSEGAARWLETYLNRCEEPTATVAIKCPAFITVLRQRLAQYRSRMQFEKKGAAITETTIRCDRCPDNVDSGVVVTVDLRAVCSTKRHMMLVSPTTFAPVRIHSESTVALRCVLCHCGEELSSDAPRPLCVVCGGLMET